eukprot:350032-Chlamydomonas_euryale.AAC.2
MDDGTGWDGMTDEYVWVWVEGLGAAPATAAPGQTCPAPKPHALSLVVLRREGEGGNVSYRP